MTELFPSDHRKSAKSPDAETVMLAKLTVDPRAIPDVRLGRAQPADAPPADAGADRAPVAGRPVIGDDRPDRTLVLAAVGGRHSSGPAKFTGSSRRRIWLSRVVLLAILGVQAALSLRMHNTAFEDEALYLYVGHLEIAHLLHGAALQGNYPSYFSGAPVLYPVLGALADSVGGLAAARAVSLFAMLMTTALLYALTRRLFNERIGLCAAAVFSVTESALYLGHLATYDAPALCLLAVASWIVVRTAAFRWPTYLLAAPLLALAVATKYATLLFVPTVVVFPALAAWPERGRKALIPPAALAAATLGLLLAGLRLAGADYLAGIQYTTTDRFLGTTRAMVLLKDSIEWGGLPFALAVIGAVAYTVRPYTEPGEQIAAAGSRLRRAALGVILAGTALLAPADQIHLHTLTSLQKHIGFGLFFAAPLAGVGLARIVGDHFRRTPVGIAVWGAALVLGMTQSNDLFNAWPNSTTFVQDIGHYIKPGAHYLVEVDEVPIYYLRGRPGAEPDQFTSTYYISYAKHGKVLTGAAGYTAAIKAGYFRVIGYNFQTTPTMDHTIARVLEADPRYRLAATISNGNDTVTQYVWVHR